MVTCMLLCASLSGAKPCVVRVICTVLILRRSLADAGRLIVPPLASNAVKNEVPTTFCTWVKVVDALDAVPFCT